MKDRIKRFRTSSGQNHPAGVHGVVAGPGAAAGGERIGVLGAMGATVQRSGAVHLEQVGGSGATVLRWWVGAEDRWYRPEHEVAVRQERLRGTPVVQTSLRIPGGDVRVWTYGAMVAGHGWVVVDLVNDSRGPVAVAVVTEGAGARGSTQDPNAVGSCPWLVEGASLRWSGQLLSVAGRSADAIDAETSLDALAARLATHLAPVSGPEPGSGSSASGGSAMAQIFALSAGASLRLLIAGHRSPWSDRPLPDPQAAPSPEAVARGWSRQLEAAAAVQLGEEAAEAELCRLRTSLLLELEEIGPAEVRALAAFGHHQEAAQRLDRALSALRAPVPADHAAGLLVAAADLLRWADPGAATTELAALLRGPALELAAWTSRSPYQERAQWALSQIVSGVQAKAAPAARQRAQHSGQLAWEPADEAGPTVEPAVSFPPGSAAALLGWRNCLVADSGDDTLVVLPGWRQDWRGRPIEVHRLPTAQGRLSFALRWHGPRPALLWQIEDPIETDGAVAFRLLAPRLDPAFVASQRRGEVLLAPPGVDVDQG